jgi:transcriptional regulator with XRE-family HTH domain
LRYFEVLVDIVKRQLPWRITRLREQHGLSQQKLATATGLSPATISLLERGRFQGLRFQTVLTLAGIFEVSLDYMAGVDHAGLVRAISIRQVPCAECGKLEGHSVATCALEMFERGRSHAYIAGRHELTVATVEFMLREEIRVLRERRRGGPRI